MKKRLFILLCSFVSFAFTNANVEPISVKESTEIILPLEVKTFPIESGTITVVMSEYNVCEEGVVKLSVDIDCDNDGIVDYSYSGKVCREHASAMIQQFVDAC
ncbi:MAG TPA: hypothetical protein VFF15_00605 [Flavobacteriaceae bacterium]|nr:hypothetical protein [Flavobacteriaceae bacterium]